MYQTQTEMTLDEVLTDPLIRAVMRADGVQMAEFKSQMQAAASAIRQKQAARASSRQTSSRAAAFRQPEGSFAEEGLFAGRKRRLLAMIQPPGGANDALCVGCH
ncbi:hypothetical protein [Pararhizobium antarcticum]|uniref:Uncharacterized protein n=1 Tax=Pararhizobium antarcticum TaxID=1798805 RepID=A0A657LUC7_9HYPH|nr:hypothetical protein [Pararhizobium antarcticum]OJF94938.1 hypothetical protein AX760_03640 [Pararhizobium antarcticum]OJF97440.1 hypothetical protein AX761_14540 [Rhizobium sp. 58]